MPRIKRKAGSIEEQRAALNELKGLVKALEDFSIIRLRAVFQLSQVKIARLAQLPVRTITRWEQAERRGDPTAPRLKSLKRLANGLAPLAGMIPIYRLE